MTTTEKILEKFEKIFPPYEKDKTHFLYNEPNRLKIKSFIRTSITQAIAEDRERVMGEIDRLKRNPKRDIVYCLSYELALDDLLSSLDTVTEKEI